MSTVAQYAVVGGAFLICLPVGIPWFYGTIAPYLNSYFRYHVGPEAFDVQVDWLLSAFIIMSVGGILTVDWLVAKFSLRWMLLASAVVFDASMFLTYFTVQHSVGATMVTLMMIGGFTVGQVMIMSLMHAPKVLSKNVGVGSAAISSGFGLGAIVMNFIMMAHVNPDNLSPDVRHKNMVFFSQSRILDLVPSLFIVLGITCVGIHCLGFLLVHIAMYYIEKSKEHYPDSKNGDEWKSTQTFVPTGDKSDSASPVENEKNAIHCSTFTQYDKTDQSAFHSDNHRTSMSTDEVSNQVSDLIHQERELNNDCPPISVDLLSEEIPSMKPREVLRTSSFYQLWICGAVLIYGNLVSQNFYKAFGQLWIKDDAFLTMVGSVSSLSMAVFRFVVGALIDRKGVKYTVMLVLSLNAILSLFWYETPRVNRWLYFFWTQALYGTQGSMYVMFPMSALKLYGPTYYATNYGLLNMSNLVTSLVVPSLFPVLMENLGWFGLFFVSGASSTLVLISLAIFMPR